MAEHTPTPWILDGTSVYYLDWDGVSYEGRGKDYRQMLTNRFWFSMQGQPKRIPKEELEANAAFIVKAVNKYDETQDLLADLWFHFSDTFDPTLRKITDRARALLDMPDVVSGVAEGSK